MGLLSYLQSDPLTFFLLVAILVVSLSAHEWGHAISALWMGDPTAKDMGRVSLNPLRHLDPFGTLLLLLVGFGWARPVPINPNNFRRYRLGLFVVSIAGIVINILIALTLTLVLRWLVGAYPAEVSAAFQRNQHTLPGTLALAALLAASINLSLAVFNLLPIPPLDGSKILQSVLPSSVQPYLWRLEANPTYAIVAMLLFLTVLRQPVAELIGWVRTVFFGALIPGF
ncbi:MAG: hypothetical protein C4332_04970 [Meiothermus sp.]